MAYSQTEYAIRNTHHPFGSRITHHASLITYPLSRFPSFLLVLLLCLPAALPYFGGDIPRSNDSLTHLYRAVELDRLVRSGNFFPRWAPDLALGYGYPIFNYFAYGSHYLIVLFHFTGLSLLWSLRLTYILSLVLSGVGAFLLARDVYPHPPPFEKSQMGEGWGGGVIAAVAYTYSPYLLYTAHVRGGLPENLALAFFPFALWAVRRALLGDSKFIVIAPLTIAAIIVSHIGMTIQQLPFIAAFGIFVIVTQPAPVRRLGSWIWGAGLLFVIFALALSLTSAVWVPAVTELPFVQFESAFANANLNYRSQFFFWNELFTLPNFPVYADLVNPPLVRSLPLVALALALINFSKARSHESRITFYFFLSLALLASFLVIDASKIIWDLIPLLQRSTFPWRFLGPASLFIALAASRIANSRWQMADSMVTRHWLFGNTQYAIRYMPFAICCVLFIFSLPMLYPPREPAPENPTLADLARYEIPPLLLGTTTTGEYTPTWVKELPDFKKNQEALIHGEEIQRLEIKDWKIERIAAQPTREIYLIAGAEAATATYRVFYFPGWEAALDGKRIQIQPTQPQGLISFDIPAGVHTLEINFGDTRVREVTAGLALATMLVLGGAGLLGMGSWKLEACGEQSRTIGNWRLFIVHCFIVHCLIVSLFIVLLLAAPSLIVRRGVPVMQNQFIGFDVAGEMTLHGYNLQYNETNKATLTLLWQAQHTLGVDYGITIRLVDENGLQWQDDSPEEPRNWRFRPGTDQWSPDQFYYDSYVLKTVNAAPPNTYQIEVVVYRKENRQAIYHQRIGEFVVSRPTNEPLAAAMTSLDGLGLVNISADRSEAGVGSLYRLSLKWQAEKDKIKDQRVKIELVSPKNEVVYSREEEITPSYPPSKWKRGDVLIQSFIMRLPASLESGEYRWRLNGVYNAPLTIRVAAPARLFVEPAMTVARREEVGKSITLIGFTLTSSKGQAIIDLIWKAKGEMSQSYRVFLHLRDAEGNVIAQSDGEPANWSRPTTSWVKDEIVIDSRTLTAPPGEYTLAAGMVDESGRRIGEVDLGAITLAP
jgi:hypothetical protein